MNNLKLQKYMVLLLFSIINTSLIYTFLIYSDKWYIYLCFLALSSIYNSLGSLYIWYKTMFIKDIDHITRRSSFVYIVPCYNEDIHELTNTIDSLKNQKDIDIHTKLLVIICDGKVMNANSEKTTDKILIEDIFGNCDLERRRFPEAYKTWDNSWNSLDMYSGCMNDLPFIILIKDKNYGKRDSLVLIRRLLYNYMKFSYKFDRFDQMFSSAVIEKLYKVFPSYSIDYIIGTDADTVFKNDCVYTLLNDINNGSDNVVGCVGFVEISPEMNDWSLWTMYQNVEYIFAQCLKRRIQSLLTHKVSCLSGCVQILKVCEELCGERVLSEFNRLPAEEENIFNHIRSYASEDRNHICIAMSMYPYIQTIQSLNALAYTKVPSNLKVFLSQRRRWSLGATMNDLLLVYKPNIVFIERVNAFINIFTYIIFPFILVASVFFIKAILTSTDLLILYLSIPMFIPFMFGLIIPLYIKKMTMKDALYFWIGFCIYSSFGFIVNTCIGIYSVLNMDVLTWGKTRIIKN